MPAIDHANCHHYWVTRVRLSRYDLIKQCDQVRRRGDGIHRHVRAGAMTSTAANRDAKILTKRTPWSGGDASLSDWQGRIYVKCDNSINPFKRPVCHHFPRATT